MAKFCTKCGKELKDGEKCDCLEKATKTEKIISDDTKKDVENLFNNLISTLKEYVKAPVDTINDNIKASKFNLAIAFVVIFGIIGGLYILSIVKESFSTVMGYIPMIQQTEPEYIKIFLYALIGLVGLIFLESAVAYLISNKVLKSDISFKKTFAVYGFSTITLSILLLAGTVLNLISLKTAGISLGAAVMLFHYYVNIIATKHFGVDKNRVQYVILATSLISTYILGFVIKELVM